MSGTKSILHELYVFSEWKPEAEYLQKSDNLFPENLSALWKWLKFFGPKKSLLDSVTAFTEKHQKWHIALGDDGKVIAVLTDNILEIRTKRSDYAAIAARTTVTRDPYSQWRKMVWSPDCSFLVISNGNGVVTFYDLTASNLFEIPIDCSRPGGLECTDNTHAVAEIIFKPLRVKDTKWSWEVLIITYDGRLRGYLVSQTEGCKLHHTFQFTGGVSAAAYCAPHATLYVAGVPRPVYKDPDSPLTAGIRAWRILNDEPFYKLSVVSDELEAKMANQRFNLFIPFVNSKNMNFIVRMVPSPNNSKLVCVHCNGDVTIWRLPLLKCESRFKLLEQREHDLDNPLRKDVSHDQMLYHPADVDWWSDDEIIMSRFSGAVSVCGTQDMVNILGKRPEFFQGAPWVRCTHDGAFVALECESNVLPAKKSQSDDSMAVVETTEEEDASMLEMSKELMKAVLYAITDMESFQPKPKRITVVSRVYRLLAVRSTTPEQLFTRKIDSGKYVDALSLASRFALDTDLVYQQQWRTSLVSTHAIQNYLSKVSKKIWVVHQCVDRLPESLPAARELLDFGLQLTNQNILDDINKDCLEEYCKSYEDVSVEDLNSYTTELLRCRHVMIFYKERLNLYQAILECEKSTYVKDEYDRLRSNSIVHSAMETAKEGRIEALTCLWPYIKSLSMQLAVLDKLPETANPIIYQHLLPTREPSTWFEKKSPIKIKPSEHEHDWCKKEIFRPIWSSNWSEDPTPESEATLSESDIAAWYERRAREIEHRSGLVSHALTLVTVATTGGGVRGLAGTLASLLTLDTLVYDVAVEDVTLAQLEKMELLDICKLMTKSSSPETYVTELREYVVPFLKRHEAQHQQDKWVDKLIDFLEAFSVDDLTYILAVFKSKQELELDIETQVTLAERCLLAHAHTHQLALACDLLHSILDNLEAESCSWAVRRVTSLERVVHGCSKLSCRGVSVSPRDLRDVTAASDVAHCLRLLTRLARSHHVARNEKTKLKEWNNVLKDMLDLQTTIFTCVSREEVHEIYASALLTSGDADSVRFAGEVLSVAPLVRATTRLIDYDTSVKLTTSAAREYFNSASSLLDPSLMLARSCLMLIERGNPDIETEIDLIEALPLLHSFHIEMLPIQVRLCGDRMKLIEDCLKSEESAYMYSEKLLQLAKMLRVAGDHDDARESMVLRRVCEQAVQANAGGVAVNVALRVAALRCGGGDACGGGGGGASRVLRAAALLPAAADTAPHTRRALLAAAAASCPPEHITQILNDRLKIEMESLSPKPAMMGAQSGGYQWTSTDDEFSDALSTPVTERKDLPPLPPLPHTDNKPLLGYLVDTIQNKFISGETSPELDSDVTDPHDAERKIHFQEFYRALYPQAEMSPWYYCYDKFSIEHVLEREACPLDALHLYYVRNTLSDQPHRHDEAEVLEKCAEATLYKDTALSVACLSRCYSAAPRPAPPPPAPHAAPALCAALYAALLSTSADVLKDDVYFTSPLQMATVTMTHQVSCEQMQIVQQCIKKLCGLVEVQRLRDSGAEVNALMYHADADYRREVIYRLAKCKVSGNARMACRLAEKYGLDLMDVWVQHLAADTTLAHLAPDCVQDFASVPHAHERIRAALWPEMSGSNYVGLINYFALLKKIDDKQTVFGLTAAEHIKLLKKAKAASPELNYKVLVEQPTEAQYTSHILDIIKPENAALLTKFLRTLPSTFKIPVPVNVIYTKWLIKFFFEAGASSSNKKWMQQYRECVSYFSKLSQDDILAFLTAVCFSEEAIQQRRVPGATRTLMLLQAADYCQQEHENELNINKTSGSWSRVCQQVGRWARFLESYHAGAARAVREAVQPSHLDQEDLWIQSSKAERGPGCPPEPQNVNVDALSTILIFIFLQSALPKHKSAYKYLSSLEMSHGEPSDVEAAVSRLIFSTNMKLSALEALLQCLNVKLEVSQLFQHIVDNFIHDLNDTVALVSRMKQYHKEGATFPDSLVELVLQKASHFGLPPHKQLPLLSLSQNLLQDSADLHKIAASTIDLIRTEWPDKEFAKDLTEECISSEEGRAGVFTAALRACASWRQRRALADVVHCWPLTRDEEGRSVQSVYVKQLICSNVHADEARALLKLLLRKPLRSEQEVEWCISETRSEAAVSACWVIALSDAKNKDKLLRNLGEKHRESMQGHMVDNELIRELLVQGMFTKLVSSPLYSSIITNILSSEASGDSLTTYTVAKAVTELRDAGFIAEAGHLKLLSMGVPASLSGFTESVLYCKKFLK